MFASLFLIPLGDPLVFPAPASRAACASSIRSKSLWSQLTKSVVSQVYFELKLSNRTLIRNKNNPNKIPSFPFMLIENVQLCVHLFSLYLASSWPPLFSSSSLLLPPTDLISVIRPTTDDIIWYSFLFSSCCFYLVPPGWNFNYKLIV